MHVVNQRKHFVVKIILYGIIVAMILGSTLYVAASLKNASDLIDQTNKISALTTAQSIAYSKKLALKKAPVFITLPKASPIKAIVEDYTQPNSLWVLVNKTRSISLTYAPSLVIPAVAERPDKSIEERSVRAEVATPLKTLFDAAQTEGHSLMVGSAYRSAILQKTYFDNYAAQSGIEAANQLSAYPGQSEHQTGLAVDISSVSKNCYLDACFTSTPDGQWLAANAYKYGFTLRYPEGKTAITGYDFEPWHYRYVGVDLATALHQSNLTLDEAWPYLLSALTTLKANGAL